MSYNARLFVINEDDRVVSEFYIEGVSDHITELQLKNHYIDFLNNFQKALMNIRTVVQIVKEIA